MDFSDCDQDFTLVTSFSTDSESSEISVSSCDTIPCFYFSKKSQVPPPPSGSPSKSLSPDRKILKMERYFKAYRQYGGIPVDEFADITCNFCELPSYCSVLLARRINELFDPAAELPHSQAFGFGGSPTKKASRRPVVRCKAFLQYWVSEMEPFDPAERLFRLLKRPDADSLYPLDLIALLQEFAALHPSLEVLSQQGQDYEDRYILAVLSRVFYEANTSRTGKLTLREFRRAGVFDVLLSVDSERDVNCEQRFFSYEHFYVLHGAFAELDEDGDGRLSRNDLLRYGAGALSPFMIDRVFMVGERAFSDGGLGMCEDGMAFPDFVYFMLSEADMTTSQAVKYWFRCCDLDGDGALSVRDMQMLFRVAHAAPLQGLSFDVVWDELRALLEHDGAGCDASRDDEFVTLDTLLQPAMRERASGVVLSSLFHSARLHAWEHRSPSKEYEQRVLREKERAEHGVPSTEWVRFATETYSDHLRHSVGSDYDFDSCLSDFECKSNEADDEMAFLFEGNCSAAIAVTVDCS